MKTYRYEIFSSEASLEEQLPDYRLLGMKPIAIYPRQATVSGDIDIIVWWEIEDAPEDLG